LQYIGKLDREKFKGITNNITTDEVILTNKQVEHIKERHPNDYEEYFEYFKEIIENPDYILIGERQGKILPGFDYGNSPSQIENVDFTGKTVIHTTSAGTQGIANAKNADVILTGSLVNAKAIAEYIKKKNFEDVSLVCMGLAGTSPIEEDTLCAEYIKSLLENNPIELIDRIKDLKKTSGAKFFDESKKDVFPEKDFYMSTDFDKFNFILKVEHKDNFDYIKKIKV